MNGREWSHRDLATLRELYPTKKSVVIAAKLNRTDNAVRLKAAKLGLRTKAKQGAHDARVKQLWRQGCYDWEIALDIDRTQQQASAIRKRLGLPATRGRKPARAVRILQPNPPDT